MRISVVTPVYNDPRVARALDSILSQREAGDVELVVIDGGSKQETQDVLARYKDRIDILVSERDRGIYDAMNKGVARATGDIVGILNADDRYMDEHVLRDVARAFEDPAVDVSYGDVLLEDDAKRPVRLWRAGRYSRAKLYLGWMPPHPGFFVRKRFYDHHGAFRLDMRIAADYEHQLRLFLKHGARPAYVPRVLVRFAVGGQSSGSWRKVVQGNREVRRAWVSNGLRGGLLVPVLKPAQKAPQYIAAKLRRG